MLQDLSPAMWPSILGAFAALLVATVALAAMQVGHYKTPLSRLERYALGAAAALIFWPGAATTAVGCAVTVGILGRKLVQHRGRAQAVAPAE
jgi:TRAP-type uncharacterized transport system fused permease subunit